MTLGKVIPFKRVVILFFFGSILVGSFLFLRAYTELKSVPKLEDKLNHDVPKSSEELHEKTSLVTKPKEDSLMHASGKVFMKNLAERTQINNIDMKSNIRENEETGIGYVVEKESTPEKIVRTDVYTSSPLKHKPTTRRLSMSTTTKSIPTTRINPTINPKFKDYGESGCTRNSLRGLFIELLSEWTKLAAQENISYFLYSGSLLGQARDEDIIPYDLDVDVVIEYKDFSKLQKISQPRRFSAGDGKFHLVVQPEYLQKDNMDDRKRYSCGGRIVPHMMDSCSFVEPMGRLIKNNQYVDIFTFIDKGDSVVIPVDYKIIHHERKDVFPIRDCRFMGIENVHCPSNVPVVLQSYFGKNLAPSKKCRGGRWT